MERDVVGDLFNFCLFQLWWFGRR